MFCPLLIPRVQFRYGAVLLSQYKTFQTVLRQKYIGPEMAEFFPVGGERGGRGGNHILKISGLF
jgi:hypothetical protein